MNTVTTRSANDGMWARGLNALLGLWLIISAYAWGHSGAQVANEWIIGLLAIFFAAIAAYSAPQARYANTILGIWLFISAFVLTTLSTATIWNNVIVGAVMFLLSLVPNHARGRGPMTRATTSPHFFSRRAWSIFQPLPEGSRKPASTLP